MDVTYDLCIVGAGMIGSAAARHASARPDIRVCLIGPTEPKVVISSFIDTFRSNIFKGCLRLSVCLSVSLSLSLPLRLYEMEYCGSEIWLSICLLLPICLRFCLSFSSPLSLSLSLSLSLLCVNYPQWNTI